MVVSKNVARNTFSDGALDDFMRKPLYNLLDVQEINTTVLSDRHRLLDNALELAIHSTVEKPLIELAEYATRGGKRLRGGLCLTVASAVGTPQEQALPLAVAVELVHAASLLLDDLPSMDDAQTRRERPCLHLVYTVAAAEITSVALLAAAFQTLCSSPMSADRRVEAIEKQASVIGVMSSGQFTSSTAGKSANAQKTASLFGYAARVGLLPLCQCGEVADRLESFGHALGLAYQALDDYVDAQDLKEAQTASVALEKYISDIWLKLAQLPEPVRHHMGPWLQSFVEQLATEPLNTQVANSSEPNLFERQ